MPEERGQGTLRILHTESSFGWGGQEIRILSDLLGMQSRGHKVLLAAPAEATLFRRARASEIAAMEVSFNRMAWPAALWRILRLIREHRIDIVNTHSSRDSWIAGLAGRLSKMHPSVVRTRHLHIPVGKSSFEKSIQRRMVHGFVTTGESVKKMLLRGLGVSEDRVVSIPTGIDLRRFEPDMPREDIRSKYGIPSAHMLLGTVAVLRSWKGHETLLEAAGQLLRKYHDMWFLLVGDGPCYDRYRKRIDESVLRRRIIMTGHLECIPEVLQSLDVFVLPSYAHEGVPQALLQAMAMKRPVITCEVGSIGEVVTDKETGRLVPPRDPHLLAQIIVELANDGDQRRRLGEAGCALVRRRYRLEEMLEKTEAFYRRIMAISSVHVGRGH